MKSAGEKFKSKYVLFFISSFVLGALYFFWMHFRYPFYFIWDMDQTTTVDLLLLHSGEIPDHINHTGFGMYFLMKYISLAAYYFGGISVISLSDLREAVEPVLGVAELTSFLRKLSPILILGTIAIIWSSLTKICTSFKYSVAILVTFLTSSSFLYHSAFIRSELYSIFFFSISLFFVMKAALLRPHQARCWQVWVLISGIFASISYFTKFQGLFYLIYLPILYYGIKENRNTEGAATAEITLNPKSVRLICFTNLIFCLFFLLGSYFRHEQGATFTLDFSINLIGVGYLVFNLILLAENLLRPRLPLSINFIHLFLFGFHLGILCHFLMFLNPGQSLKYLLLDAKMIFYRNNYYGNYAGLAAIGNFFRSFIETVKQLPFLFLGFFLTSTVSIYLAKNRRLKILGFLLFLVTLLNAIVATRGILRDVLWFEILTTITVIIFILQILGRAKNWRYSAGAFFIFLFIIIGNIYKSSSIPLDTDANFNNYGWQVVRTFFPVYEQKNFLSIMEMKYPLKEQRLSATLIRSMKNFSEHMRVASYTFLNQKITAKNLGYFYYRAPIDPLGYWRMTEFSPELSNAILIDNFYLPRSSRSLAPDAATGSGEGYTKIRYRSGNEIAILNRDDYSVFLFMPQEQLKALGKPPYTKPSNFQVTIRGIDRKEVISAIEIENFIEIDPKIYSKIGFFAILPKP